MSIEYITLEQFRNDDNINSTLWDEELEENGFGELEELIDRALEDGADEVSEEFWICIPEKLTMDATHIIEDYLEQGDHYEDAFGSIPKEKLEAFQTFLDSWCKEVNIETYIPQHNLRLRLTAQEREDFKLKYISDLPDGVPKDMV